VLGLVSRLCGWVGPLLVTGETVDMEQAWRGDCTEAGIRRMLELKTGVLLRYCAEAGSVVGTGVCDWESEAVAAAGRFAAKTGLAFQLKDDLLGVFAEEDELGKPVGSDIREGKRTLLYARGLNLASATARERLLTFLGSPDIGKRELDEVRGILTGTGARQEIEDECRVLVDEACEALRRFPACLYRDLLEQWALFVVERRL
jgi:geranylgeranyl diphosphate synthase type I